MGKEFRGGGGVCVCVYVCVCVCMCVFYYLFALCCDFCCPCCTKHTACTTVNSLNFLPILPHSHHVKSALWWAPREPCVPVHICWLALHVGMGNINNEVRLCGVCVGVCMCINVCVGVCVCAVVSRSRLAYQSPYLQYFC